MQSDIGMSLDASPYPEVHGRAFHPTAARPKNPTEKIPAPPELTSDCGSKLTCQDRDLRGILDTLTQSEAEYWSFRGKAVREHAHAYFQYPAMMVPQMQAELIRAVRQVNPETKTVYDPFVGSGTVLGEAMMQGMAFFGWDINPLAVLLCRAKSGTLSVEVACSKATQLYTRMDNDRSESIAIDFPNLHKWFRCDVAIALSRIRRAIVAESELWFRQFLWVALAETVRLTSNSRTSTFKLHTRKVEEIAERSLDPVGLFTSILHRNLENMKLQRSLLEKSGLLHGDCYYNTMSISHRDARKPTSSPAAISGSTTYDLLLTSPPYGDNSTTVPYGQHSYLPLQWIDLSDIDQDVDSSWLSTTHEIDRRSLGGIRRNAMERAEFLRKSSPSFSRILDDLKDHRRDRPLRVSAFCCDLYECLTPILTTIKQNGYMIWTVGNRCVGGLRIPLDAILQELLEEQGAKHVHTIERCIPTKRQASSNSYAKTMSTETILVMRNGSV